MSVTQRTVHIEIKMLRWYGPAERRDDVEERSNSLDSSGKHGKYGDEREETKNINKGQEKF